MPPTNNTAATATLISSFPYDHTQTDINDTGVNYDVWYKFVAPTGSKMMSIWGFSGNTSSGYRPFIKPYDEEASLGTINGILGQNQPIQLEVTAGEDYWIKFEKNLDDAVSNQVRVRVSVFESSTIVLGSIIINDDTGGFPCAVASHITDYEILDYISGVPGGEGGDCLSSGIMCFADDVNFLIKIYDNTFTLTFTSPGFGTFDNIGVRRNANDTKFWVTDNTAGPNPIIRSVETNGTFGSNHTLTGVASIFPFCVGPDDSTLYYAENSIGASINTWNLTTDTLIGTFIAGITNYTVNEILVFEDGTIAVLFEDTISPGAYLKVYNSGGTLLNSYSLGSNRTSAARMTWGGDGISVWVYLRQLTDAVFLNVRLSDGVVLATRHHALYTEGAYEGESATPTALFGVSNSCPIMALYSVGEIEEPEPDPDPPLTHPGGIYYVYTPSPPASGTPPSPPTIPTSWHDSYNSSETRKIPDPTVRTALIGE